MCVTYIIRFTLAAVLLPSLTPLWAAQQERPLLTRPVLGEVIVADFSKDFGSAKAIHPQSAVRLADGRLVATFPPREDAAVLLRNGAPIDLSGMDVLRFDIDNVGPGRVSAALSLTSGAQGSAHAVYALTIDAGVNALVFPLWTVVDEHGAPFDRTRITEISLTVRRSTTPTSLRIAKVSGQKLFADAGHMRFFDFGSGAVAAGAASVRADSHYAATRGYGIAGGSEIVANAWRPEFTLFGDGLSGNKLSFRVDLPVGDYEVQTVAYGMNWMGARCVSYRITADGVAVVDERITPERFRSYELQYYGADIFFDPSKTLFDQYHRSYFKAHRFDVHVHDGHLTLTFEDASPRALWLYPKSQVVDGRALVDACYAEEGHHLWLSQARVREHAVQAGAAQPTDADRARGYQLFSKEVQQRIYPNQAPLTTDLISATGLSCACAPGEFEPLSLVIRPLQDLGQTSITFTAPALGGAPSPVAIRPFVVKYVPIAVDGMWYEAMPCLLYPYSARELTKHWNCQYWVTLQVPTGTPAGTYTGSITIAPHSGSKTVIPVTLTVYPFDLPKTTSECGMWNCGPWSNHQIGAFPTDKELGDRLIEAEVADMADHGLNGYQLGCPDAGDLDRNNQHLPLDFSKFSAIAAALTRHGMTGRHLISVLNLANYRLMRHGVAEFSPEFNKIYLGIMTELRDWLKQTNTRAVLQVTDECRETELNDWNRNRVDTLKHLRLARQVDGLQLMVTLMGDTDGFNRPYTPLIPLMDVVSCHSWPRSDDQIFLTTVEKMADLWSYNNGFTRFAFGFYLWKSQALGHWQWVYSWESCDAHVPVFISGDPSAAYAVPGGYLDTLKFENVREGIDDHRYLELLNTTLANAAKDAPAVADANKFLDTLDKFLPTYPSNTEQHTGAEAGANWDESAQTTYFSDWRAQIAEYITAVREKRVAKRVDAAWAMFPQALVAEQRTLTCKLVAVAPTIDGKGDDAAWANVPEAGNFLNLARGVRAATQTTVKMTCDGQRLYVLMTCTEPKYGELKAYATERDDQCWEDDSVELFLDTRHDQATYKHIIINCLGTVQDADVKDGVWNADIVTAVARGHGSWTVESSITLASLGGGVPQDGTVWGVNVCRNRQPQPPEISSWAFVGASFHNAKAFGTLTFLK